MFLIAFCCRFLQIIRNKFSIVISKLVKYVFFEVINRSIRNGH
ncbi:unnamed protein product [Staphylococcus haemolyticus JCSC1435]|uniref:Uncharacterized protein n=1 Tax=Staphylococcus haemolyticus (strain JCSC1435) TaxID=279808 RepID=Q4L327_STAHJ|nr:unnamed protein product [Staphylococcus haemolyticus JCSC1435]